MASPQGQEIAVISNNSYRLRAYTGSVSINSSDSDCLNEDAAANSGSCCLRSNRKRCKRFCYDRIPKGKGSLLVFLLNVIETFALLSAVDGVLNLIFYQIQQTEMGYAVSLALQSCIGKAAYPLTGFVADVYLGRYRMIHIGLWLMVAAHCLLAMMLSLSRYLTQSAVRYGLGVIAYALVSVGSASFEANIIPFGVDQLAQGPSSAEMSSYFYWYYLGRQLGALAGCLVFVLLTIALNTLDIPSESPLYQGLTCIPSVIVVLVLAIAIVMHHHLKHWYFRDSARPNPLKLVAKVLWYAATAKRQFPRYRRAFRYGERKKPRIELAKIDYDGIYERKDVEDVKSFCRLVLVLVSLGGYAIVYTGVYAMLSFQISNLVDTLAHIDSSLHQYLSLFVLWNILTILIFLPVLNHLVLPYWPLLSMKKRISAGMFLGAIATAVAAILEFTVHTMSFQIQLVCFLLPTSLLAISEVLVIATTLEFLYAQTPESAKGLITGTFYLFWGAFGLGGLLSFHYLLHNCPMKFPNKTTINGTNPILLYYVALTVIGAVGFVMYSLTACLYTNRQRPNLPEDESYCNNSRNAWEWYHAGE